MINNVNVTSANFLIFENSPQDIGHEDLQLICRIVYTEAILVNLGNIRFNLKLPNYLSSFFIINYNLQRRELSYMI